MPQPIASSILVVYGGSTSSWTNISLKRGITKNSSDARMFDERPMSTAG